MVTFLVILYAGGNGARHNIIDPNDATSYFTISGKSFPKYISKWVHNGVHLIKWLKLFSENSPWMTTDASFFWMNSIFPPDSDRYILELAKFPSHENIKSLPTDLISILSDIPFKSRIIFWKSVVGKLIMVEYSTSGTISSSISGSINRNFWL